MSTTPQLELDQKGQMVQGIFSKIARKYDTFNALSSMGIYKSWLRRVADIAACKPTERVLDVAGGTGDVSFELCRRCAPASVEVSDFTPEMLDVARARAEQGASCGVPCSFQVADAMNLPYGDASFDVLTMAYGLRNFSDRKLAMREAARVLRPGGRAVILEFGTPPNPAWRALYHVYLMHIVPAIGGLVCGDSSGFKYLASSIREFPVQSTVAQELRDAGFEDVSYRNCTGGIAAVYEAHKAPAAPARQA
jgi:demethylmenaquinone methyltransferase / 2-methoxy-6-polyprenyl-1,4-benzoquinol methylase